MEIITHIEEYRDPRSLSPHEQELVQTARDAARNAYAPYSHFMVGAALLLENGRTIAGNNQENASFPDGLCAERVALFSATANHPEYAIRCLAIASLKGDRFTDSPACPCGSCRQALLEAEIRFAHKIRIIMYGQERIYAVESVRDLLPLGFEGNMFEKV